MLPEIDDIRKVTVTKDDVIVVRSASPLSQFMVERTRDRIKEYFPDNKCIVLDCNMSLDVVTLNGE